MIEEHSPEDFWATIHCTSTLITKINDKRVSENKDLSEGIVVNDMELSVSNSKKENIELFLNLISNKSLKPLAQTLITDMYKYDFDASSSVDSDIEDFDENKNLKKLGSISLLQHSFGVLNMMSKVIDRKFGLYSDLFFIAALVHDFGKSNSLKSKFNIDISIAHHEASSEYLKRVSYRDKKITQYYRGLLEMVCEVFEAHHTKNLENLFYATKKEEDSKELQILLMKYLKLADSMQRDIELEMLRDL